MKLTIKMQETVRDSSVGQFLSRLIEEEFARGGDCTYANRAGNVIQSLWEAFMSGAGLPFEAEYEDGEVGFDPPNPKIDALVARRKQALLDREKIGLVG